MKSAHIRVPAILGLLAAAISGCAGSDDASTGDDALTAATSGYTSLVHADCKVFTPPPAHGDGGGSDLCGGMDDYGLIVQNGDGRQNLVVKTPRAQIDLGVWQQEQGFGHLGDKAEWRGSFASPGKVHPYALIFRYSAIEDPNHPDVLHPYLFVARITPDAACIVDKVDAAQPNANVAARVSADAKATMACPGAASSELTSAYTDSDPTKCTKIPSDPHSSVYDCGGMGDFKATYVIGDERDDLTITTPDHVAHGLNAWNIDQHFSHLGPKAEWRGTFVAPGKVNPTALIFRFISTDTTVEPERDHDYLVVAKLNATEACIVSVVDVETHGADANVEARRRVDGIQQKACPTHTPAPN